MMKGTSFWQMQSQLLVAIKYGDIEQCSRLLALGADCDQMFQINSCNMPAICVGAERGAIKLVELLIRSGSAINRRDSKGYTPLHHAVEMNHINMSKLLIENRANVNAVDNCFVSPLHIAAKRGSLDLVQYLLSNGADVTRTDQWGKTPLIYGMSAPNINVDVVECLLANGSDPNTKDDMGLTPLLYALLSPTYSFKLVNILVSLNVRLDILTPDEKSPLHLVIQSSNPDKWKCLKLLLKHGCEKDALNNMRQSPIHLACLMGDINSLRILLRASADPNTLCRLGTTPLISAANGGKDLIDLLVDGGLKADINVLKILNLHWLIPRMTQPSSLLEISRLALLKHLKGCTEDWIEENYNQIPANLLPFLLFEQ